MIDLSRLDVQSRGPAQASVLERQTEVPTGIVRFRETWVSEKGERGERIDKAYSYRPLRI